VLVELSPVAYLALCGLVRDALEVESDAKPLLERVAQELMGATAGGMVSSELTEEPDHLEALRRGGFYKG
jgi:rubrerythrin